MLNSVTSNVNNASALSPKPVEALPSMADAKVASPEANQSPDLKALHQVARLKDYRFRKISSEDSSLEPSLRKLLLRHNVFIEDKYKYNNAALSEDGKTLVLCVDGQTLLSNYFGGQGIVSRFFNKTIGFFTGLFGAADKFAGAKQYNLLYQQGDSQNPDGERGESLPELRSGLYANHYHGTVVYEKDPATGLFEKKPKIIGITDAYMLLIRPYIELIKPGASEEEIKALEQKFKKYYSLDKVIPMFSVEEKVDFNELRHKVIEGLYQAQGFDFLAVPAQIDANSNSNTNDLSYSRINWNDLRQLNNGEWKILKDNRQITFVRPISMADDSISEEVAMLDALSQASSGEESRMTNKDFEILKEVAGLNQPSLKLSPR